ncbi:hypothetical protein ZIOFF_055839 [Zingiber officinale]|uniref:Histone deacetylase complex subunit SAP30 Sin3 binding domain-containing protein n=1 Tax=Zingiber officinale TaxID=94328 RepID=A0A8J5FFL2_ZINOF|nr:hypothetical protein ZIOFF_055839 [Zingiber officinale]
MPGMSGGCQQSFGENSEEDLALLPRHTKVVVTGNNRTKSVLVGLHGVVKKAVGLGGWHWLVLTNGIEVKLQRNALSVVEAPTGHEEDDETECEWNGSDMASGDMKTTKPHKMRARHHKGSSNKSFSRSHSCDSHKGSVSSSRGTLVKLTNRYFLKFKMHVILHSLIHLKKRWFMCLAQTVDLSKLETRALWRYWHHFNLHQVGACRKPSKEQLVDIVQRHFMSQQLDELQVIIGFVHAAKRLKMLYS